MSDKNTVTYVFQKPQINLARSTASRMWLVNICAFLAVIQSSLTDSYSSLFIALSAVSSAVLTEFLILYRTEKRYVLKDGSTVASALILTLLLPNSISPIYAALGAAFAIAVIKHSFGGLGSNWLNPAAGGWLFIRFSWPAAFTTNVNAVFSTASSSPSSIDSILSSFFNKTIFTVVGVELPAGYIDLFASRLPGIIADRAVFALLLGTLVITASQAIRSWVPLVYLTVFSILVRLFRTLPYEAELMGGDLIYSLCTGGTLIAAFFLTADPVTSAKSTRGILLTTVIAAGITFIFRFFGNEPYGAVLTAVFINAMLPMVRVLEGSKLYGKQGKPS